ADGGEQFAGCLFAPPLHLGEVAETHAGSARNVPQGAGLSGPSAAQPFTDRFPQQNGHRTPPFLRRFACATRPLRYSSRSRKENDRKEVRPGRTFPDACQPACPNSFPERIASRPVNEAAARSVPTPPERPQPGSCD